MLKLQPVMMPARHAFITLGNCIIMSADLNALMTWDALMMHFFRHGIVLKVIQAHHAVCRPTS